MRLGLDPLARLDKALAEAMPEAEALSRSRVARLLAAGAVTRDGVTASGKDRAEPGAEYAIRLSQAAESHMEAEAIPLAIVYEDDDLIVIDKPAGMVVHPAPGSPSGTLVNALMAHCGERLSGVGGVARPGIVHRIDKDTSGLLVAAKTDRAHGGLAAQFEAHSAERAYLAICHGVPSTGDARVMGLPGVSAEGATLVVTTRLDRHRTDRQRQAVFFDRGRHSVTRLRVLEPLGAAALIECRLETGRTHQIRVHMAHLGHALIGDPVYGGRRRLSAAAPGVDAANAFPRQALHAASLGFVHPVSGAHLAFAAPLPADMTGLLSALRDGAAGRPGAAG